MKDDSDPSYSEELANLPTWDRSLWLSRAFIEASSYLCAKMLEGDFSSQYSSSRVILHLARQGIELFLKGAIDVTGVRAETFSHNIDKLFIEYRTRYPEQNFYFRFPSIFIVDVNGDLFPDTTGAIHATLDQRYRYAADKQGRSFATPEIFDPIQTRKEIEELQHSLQIIEWCHLRPSLAACKGAA